MKKQEQPDSNIEKLISKEIARKYQDKTGIIGEKRVAIILHGTPPPDPDAIFSGMALQYELKSRGIEADIFGSAISHPQNKSMLSRLRLELKDQKFWEENSDHYGLIILCDTDIGNAAIQDIKPDIIIDHHAENKIHKGCLTIRRQVGACATIVYFLLKELGVRFEYPSSVATAMVIGIDSDTKSLTKENEVTDHDVEAHAQLRATMDYPLFASIAHNYEIPKTFFKCLGMKIEEVFFGYLALVGVGEISQSQSDYLGMIADLVHRVPETRLTVVIGVIDGQYVRASVRSNLDLIQIDHFCKEVFEADTITDTGRASAGARVGSGGAIIPLSNRERGEWSGADQREKEVLFRILMRYYMDRIHKAMPNE